MASAHASLVVLGCEAYGRWSTDAISLMRELAKLKAAEAPARLRTVAEFAWLNRWWGIVGVGVQRAVAESLLWHGGADLLGQHADRRHPTLSDVLLAASA